MTEPSATMTTLIPADAKLTADCDACSALCCVTHPFDAAQGFGFDKPAHTPCQHLQHDFRCGIHQALHEKGFAGCVLYTCHGAGQRVTRLCGEQNWRAAPAQATMIYSVFSQMKSLHELQFLLHTAYKAVQDMEWQQRIKEQQLRIETLCCNIEQYRREFDLEEVREQTRTLLRQLATQPAIVALRSNQPARG